MAKEYDAYELLAQAKMREAKQLRKKVKSGKKKKKKKDKPLWRPQHAVNPFPRINWENKKRYYVTAHVASTEVGEDNVTFSDRCMLHIANTRKYEVYPAFYNFDTTLIIGNIRISGIKRLDNRREVLVGNFTTIVPMEFAEKMHMMYAALTVTVEKSRTVDGVRIIDQCKIISASLLSEDVSVDPLCKVIEILKDSDIDKRLEE